MGACYRINASPTTDGCSRCLRSLSRMRSTLVFSLGIGTGNLFHTEEPQTFVASVDIANLGNKVALYNFLSTFSGPHFLQPRLVVARIGLVF